MKILKKYLPRAGMIYPLGIDVFGLEARDLRILSRLERAGIISTGRGVQARAFEKDVDKALAEVFTAALSPAIFAKLTGQCKGSYDHLLALRDATSWANKDWTVTWFKFFLGMVYARMKWKANPRPPFNINEHGATAKSIDAFLDAAKDVWSPVHFAFEQRKREHNKPNNDEQFAAVEATSTVATSSPAMTSGDKEFDMGSLMAALMLDTAADDILAGIQRMVIKDDEDGDGDAEDVDGIF